MTIVFDPLTRAGATFSSLPAPTVNDQVRVNPLLLAPARAVIVDRWWPRLLGVVAGVGYLVVGYWMLHGRHYAIGDALARASAARSIVDGRDPHLSAIGFVWMPLPTFVQIPAMTILSRIGLAAYSGILMTSVAGALTIPAVARITQDLRLSRGRSIVLTLCYALSPFTIFYSANGMSEAWAALFTALALRLFLRWMDHHRIRDLGGLGISLGLLTLCRYEGVAIAGVLAVAAALIAARNERIWTAAVVALPTAFVLFCWSVLCRVLLDDALFWLHGLDAVADPPANAPWLPHTRNVVTVGGYALRLVLIVAPALLLLIPLSLRRRSATTSHRVPISILIVGAIYPLQVMATVLRGDGWGNLRYFSPLVLITTVIVAWQGARAGTSDKRRWRLCLLGILVGLITGWGALASPRIAAVEGEYAVAGRIGSDQPATIVFPLDAFMGAAGYLDAHTGSADLIAAETASAFTVTLFTKHPERFAITQDTDFEQLVARSPTAFTWIVQVAGTREATSGSSLDRVLSAPPPGTVWNRVEQFDQLGVSIKIFHLEPVPAEP